MRFEDGLAYFAPDEAGLKERKAFKLPEDAPDPIAAAELASIALPLLFEISEQRLLGEPVDLCVMGLRSAIVSDLLRANPKLTPGLPYTPQEVDYPRRTQL